MVCGRCKRIYYCSRECQRSHFKQHKAQCKAWAAGTTVEALRTAEEQRNIDAHETKVQQNLDRIRSMHAKFNVSSHGSRTGCLTPRQAVREKYGLDREDKAAAVSDYLTGKHADSPAGKVVTPQLLAAQFGLEEADAEDFLAFVNMSVEFKQQQLREAKPVYGKP